MTESRDLATGNEQMSPAAKQKARLDSFMGALEQRNDQLATLLSDSNVDPKVFLENARRAFMRTPDLLNCDAASVIESFINCATDGVKPDGRQAAIVIYNTNVAPKGSPKRYVKKAQYICMFQGLLDIAYRSGNFRSIMAHVVYEGDVFEYSLGMRPEVSHKPAPRAPGAVRPIVAAYAVAITKDGGEFFEPFTAADIDKVKKAARAVSGPWQGWESEMIRKGPLRRLWKWLPKDDRMARLGERDQDSLEFLTDEEMPEEVPERKLKPGFAPPAPAAIAQGADVVMETAVPEAEEVLDADFEETEVVEPAPAKQAQVPLEKAEPLEQAPPAKEWDVFMVSLEVANTWLNIKQALRSLAKWEQFPAARREAFIQSWTRFEQLRSDGGERTDFLDDNTLWEVWLVGANPPQDAIDGNWRVFQKTTNFQKASPEEQERLRALVEPAQG